MIIRDVWTFIIIGLFLTVVAIWAAVRWDSKIAFSLALILAVTTVFVVFFFRDPDRSVVVEPNLLVSPADGRIVKIETLESHPFVGDRTIRVSIFLSIFDVHVNRVPTSGTIDYVKYNPGRFMAAFFDKASELNEQTEIGMVSESGHRIVFKQIAGMIARRIVCHLKKGDHVETGQRFGMIRFGSRTDLLVPEASRIMVKVGDHVYGGESVIGYLSQPVVTNDSIEFREEVDEQL